MLDIWVLDFLMEMANVLHEVKWYSSVVYRLVLILML